MISVKKARKAVNRWVWLVDWLGWTVDIYYVREGEEFPGTDNAAAVTFHNFGYLTASVYLKLNEIDEDNIDMVVVHELCHLLLSPVDDESTPHKNIEYCATTISRALVKLAEQRYGVPKNKK